MVRKYAATGERGERVPRRHGSWESGNKVITNITQSNDCVIAYYRRTWDTKGRVTDTYPTAATIQYQARARLIYDGKVTTLQIGALTDQLESARARRVRALAECAEYVMPRFFVRTR